MYRLNWKTEDKSGQKSDWILDSERYWKLDIEKGRLMDID
jgi:hypothetical protein